MLCNTLEPRLGDWYVTDLLRLNLQFCVPSWSTVHTSSFLTTHNLLFFPTQPQEVRLVWERPRSMSEREKQRQLKQLNIAVSLVWGVLCSFFSMSSHFPFNSFNLYVIYCFSPDYNLFRCCYSAYYNFSWITSTFASEKLLYLPICLHLSSLISTLMWNFAFLCVFAKCKWTVTCIYTVFINDNHSLKMTYAKLDKKIEKWDTWLARSNIVNAALTSWLVLH